LIVCDACVLINLQKADLLTVGADLPCAKFCMGSVVASELEDGTHTFVDWESRCVLIQPDVDAVTLASAIKDLRLGAGETESLLLAERDGYCVLSDDRRARNVAREKLGRNRVVGSMRWLAHLVAANRITPMNAWAKYQGMRAAGAFLPDVPDAEFLDLMTADEMAWPCANTCIHT
jgi:predicted nucleic acid-binding protein